MARHSIELNLDKDGNQLPPAPLIKSVEKPVKAPMKHTIIKRDKPKPKREPKSKEAASTEVPVSNTPLTDPLTREKPAHNPLAFKFMPVIRAEQWWVEQAREDPAFFVEYMTGLVPAKHHRIWLANIFHPERKRLNFIAPRDSAKTTYAMYAQAWIIGRAPLLTNGLISVSAAQAEDRLRMIHGMLDNNTRYKNVFPHIYLDKSLPVTQQQFTVASNINGIPRNVWRAVVERRGSLKDATMFVAGVGGRGIIGRRFSGLLILDDIIDDTYLKDELQEAVMEYVMRTLIPCVKEEGKVINIGTRWMVGDVPERLMNNPSWKTIQIKAIQEDDHGERRSYWPEYWPIERLDAKKAEMNNDALFNIMYMNDPTAMTAALFTQVQLDKNLPVPMPKLKAIHVSTDFAMSEKTSADFSVFAAIGIDNDDNYYVLDMQRIKANTDNAITLLGQFCDRVAASWSQYGTIQTVLIEKVGFQALVQSLTAKLRPDLPVVPHVPKGDKMHRARYVSTMAANGKVFFNQSIGCINQMKAEYLNFPLARHDDTLDAVSLLFQYIGGGMSVRNTRTIKSSYLL